MSGSSPSHSAVVRSWEQAHGVTASPFVARWVLVMHTVARPLVACRISATGVTVLAILATLAAVAGAARGGGWVFVAAFAAGIGALCDGLDGAVARMTDSATARGAVIDAVADRVNDVLLLLALWCAGGLGIAAATACVAAGIGAFGLEYSRARVAAAGIDDGGVITVGERPSRVLLAIGGLLTIAVFPEWAGNVATGAAGIVAALAFAGWAHYLFVALSAGDNAVGPAAVSVDRAGLDESRDDAGREHHQRQTATGMGGSADEK
jgi:phosphatidylglycerophosphate synthase